MDSCLYKAIATGNSAILDQFNLLEKTYTKKTALHVAVEFAKNECVEVVLKLCPSSLLKENMNGETALHIAARQGLDEIVALLIQCAKRTDDGDVEIGSETVLRQLLRAANNKRNTALHEAVQNKHYEVVKLLAEAEPAFEYFANDAGETPLYLAVDEGLKEMVKQILQTCPSSAHGGRDGQTALHAAVIRGDSDIIELLRAKSDINKKDDEGRTPLYYAAYLGHSTISLLLLESDIATAYTTDVKGFSPLHVAASQGKKDVIQVLIERHPDCLELRDHRGQNFLHIAASRNEEGVVEDALKRDLISAEHIDQLDDDGNTPLHIAAISGAYGIFNLLCEDDRVNKMAINNERKTVLDLFVDLLTKSDVNLDNDDAQKLVKTLQLLEDSGVQSGKRVKIHTEIIKKPITESKDPKEDDKKMAKKYERVSDGHLVVAALIATVTFTAGFTLPGGFESDGPNKGMAIMLGSTAFRAFTISNTIAMLLSCLAVLCHFVAKLMTLALGDIMKVVSGLLLKALFCTLAAIFAMMLAFATGLYAVLAHSPGLAATTCLISCSFYLFCLYPFLKHLFRILILKQNRVEVQRNATWHFELPDLDYKQSEFE